MILKPRFEHLLKLAQITLFLIAFAIPSLVSAQWNPVYIPADDFNAIEVIGQDTVVCATGWGGRMHRSFDGGQSWTGVQTIFNDTWFLDIHFPTKNVGYACGGTAFGLYSQVIIKTQDAGLTWDSLTANAFGGYEFTKIHFVNADTGFVCGDPAGLVKTFDGGATFVLDSLPNNGSGSEIYFESAANGFVATYRYISAGVEIVEILRTTDVGNTWSTVYSDTFSGGSGNNRRRISKLFFLDANTGFAVGGSGLFLKTTDGGISWNRSFIAPFNNLTALHFNSPNDGYVNNAGGIARTTDGGATWNSQNLSLLAIVFDLSFANDSVGYAVTEHGVIKTSNSGGALSISEPDYEPLITLFPNPSTASVNVRIEDDVIKKIDIFGMKGDWIQTITSNFDQIDLSRFANGSYSFSIETKRGKIVRKVIKK